MSDHHHQQHHHHHQVGVLKRFQKARDENNVNEMLECLDDHAEVVAPLGTFKGKIEIAKWFTEKSDLPEWEDHWHHVDGHHFQRKGVAKRPLVTIHLSQDVWIHDGRIQKVVVQQVHH
eukprot:TRINITY_DN1157_c0_g1_i1.p1 TRINITY_DN1157_c0_g1~~TRINITY_DN1157_c0_g1_i1.p1  ORF type:complete len:134 (-),score=43.65 TRINITY_DN1157_c0_g1_i1:89-442(-)